MAQGVRPPLTASTKRPRAATASRASAATIAAAASATAPASSSTSIFMGGSRGPVTAGHATTGSCQPPGGAICP